MSYDAEASDFRQLSFPKKKREGKRLDVVHESACRCQGAVDDDDF